MIVCCEKSGSGHRVFQMESKMDDGWNIGMPVLLDCLRKDIYSLISKLSIPQDDQVQIGKLIEQIRLEEARYEQDIRKQITERTISAREEIANLKRQYSELQSLQGEKEDSGKTNGVVSSSIGHFRIVIRRSYNGQRIPSS